MRVWIADDDELVHMLIKRIVSKGNFDVEIESFFDGKAISDQLLRIKDRVELLPDLVILDINMPMYDGWYMIEEFVKLNPEVKEKVKVYICSSSIAPFDKEKADSCKDIADFIEKPLTIDKFQLLVNLES
jgi:CheY-like chemotaxis protein